MIRKYDHAYEFTVLYFKRKSYYSLLQMDLMSYAGAAADEIINLMKIMKEDITKIIQSLKLAQDRVGIELFY